MDISFEKEQTGEIEYKLKVTIPAETVTDRVEDAISSLARKAQFPGFRPGRMPRKLIVQKYGQAITAETVQQLLQEAYKEALSRSELHPAAPGEMSEVSYDSGTPLSFSVKLEVFPEIEIPDLSGLTVEQLQPEASEEDVAVALDSLRYAESSLVPTDEGADLNSVITVDIRELDASGLPIVGRAQTDAELDLHRVNLGEDFATKVQGMKAGGTFVAEVPSHSDRGTESKTSRLQFVIIEVKHRDVPALDEAFVKMIRPDLSTVDELRADIQAYIEARAAISARDRMYREVVELLLRGAKFPMPSAMVEDYLNNFIEHSAKSGERKLDDKAREELKEKYRASAIHNLRWYMLRKRIIQEQKLDIGKLEMEAELDRLAGYNGETVGEFHQRLSDAQLENIREDIRERKVLKYLEEQITVMPRRISLAEFEGRTPGRIVTA